MSSNKIDQVNLKATELSKNADVSNAVGAIIGVMAIFILAVIFVSYASENFMQSYMAKVDAYGDSMFDYFYEQEGILLLAMLFALMTGLLCGVRIAAEKNNYTISTVAFAVFAIATIITIGMFWANYVFGAILFVTLLCFAAVGMIIWMFMLIKSRTTLMTFAMLAAAIVLAIIGLLYAVFLFNFPTI